MIQKKTVGISRILTILIALLVVATFGVTSSFAADEKPIKIRIAGFHPVDALLSTATIGFFMKRAGELSKGKLTFDYYPFESLIKGADMATATSSGVIDMGNMVYAAGKVPSYMVAQIPYSFRDDQVVKGSLAFSRLCTDPNQFIFKQFMSIGVRPMFAFGTTNYQAHTVSKVIKTLDDFKGVKVRVAGSVLPITVKKLGGVPVSMTIGDAYSAMEKNVVDGIMLACHDVPDFPIKSLIRHSNISFDTGVYPTVWGMNPKKFDSLPPEYQKILIQVSEEAAVNVATQELEITNRLKNEWKASSNHSVEELSAEDYKKAYGLTASIGKEWAAEMDSKGMHGQELLNAWKAALKAQGITPQW